ncbi:MAG: Gfo/Idh/MocA family oxidoreductase [Dysgonamonadaceae bacterium]|jgi:predicted dehydrogenase|nr:Gfo/Idh/MocA family oxidoreductase [Dysgonamonadaceae bacterium]
MANDKIKFAVVGCGHIGKRHIEMISRNPEAELVAVCDVAFCPIIEPLTGDSRLRGNDKVSVFSSLDALLSSNIPFDALNICTPNGLHAPMAIAAIEAGHHVVVEKPMALTSEDAGQILSTAERYGKKVFCVMQNRYSPPSVWIKDLVDSGRVGKIFMVEINCFWNRDARYYQKGSWHGTKDMDGGTLFTQFSHFVDLMYWLFGDIKNIRSRFADFNHRELTDFEDSGTINFDFTKGGMGIFNFSTSLYDRNFESSVTIIAENGTVKIGGQYMNEVEYCNIRDYDMPTLPPTNPGNDYGAYKGSAQNHHYVIENVINVLKNKGEHITTNAYEGYKVVEIIERMMQS